MKKPCFTVEKENRITIFRSAFLTGIGDELRYEGTVQDMAMEFERAGRAEKGL